MLRTCSSIAGTSVAFGLFALGFCVTANAAWQALGPFGGPAEAVLVAPGKSNTLLAAAHNALLYRSDDGGAHWTPLAFPDALSFSVRVMKVADDENATYFLGGVAGPTSASALYSSSDQGATWQPVPGLQAKAVYSLAIWKKDSNVIAAGCDTGVFLSEDSGRTWRRISSEQSELHFITALAIDPESRDTIFAGTAHLPWKTTDGGQTWNSIHRGMIDDSDVFSIEIDPANTMRVVASACSGIYLSEDSGGNWAKVLGVPRTSRRTYTIRRDPAHPESLYAGTSQGLWKSTNNGIAWTRISNAIVKSIAFDPTQDRFFLATENQGLLTSRDQGKTFQAINDGFVNSSLTSLAESNNALVGATPYDWSGANVLRLSLTGTWSTVKPPAGVKQSNLLSITPVGGSSLLGVNSTGGFLTTDGGKTWKNIGAGHGRVRAIQPLGPRSFLLGTSSGLFRSNDAGLKWSSVVSNAGVDAIYSSGKKIVVDAGETLFVSEDQGATWNPVMSPVPAHEVYGIAIGANNLILAGTARGAFRSSDAGRSWERIPDLTNTVRAIAFDPQGTTAVAIQQDTVYLSSDEGAIWAPLDMTGMEGASIFTLLIPQTEPGKVFAATHARGVFVAPITGASPQPRATQASAANSADGNMTRSNQSPSSQVKPR